MFKRNRNTALGVFDCFPDSEEKTSFQSPLSVILASLPAATSSGSPEITLDVCDPWESIENHTESDDLLSNSINLKQRRSSCGGSPTFEKRTKRSSSARAADEGMSSSACAINSALPLSHSLSRTYTGQGLAINEEANLHVEDLLRDTPQLRLICPESRDMTASSPNALNLVELVTKQDTKSSALDGGFLEYQDSLTREAVNERSATELVNLMRLLAHEMPLEEYGFVENRVFTSVFSLVHSSEKELRLAGVVALDALLAAPSADEERKTIKFANTLSTSLRVARGDYEFLSSVSKAFGHMAMKASNVDFVESEVCRALEWLRMERSDRRLAACLVLKEFAVCAPTTFHSKTTQSTIGSGSNVFLDHIFEAVGDPQPIVRVCAADALSQCLKILVERKHISLTGLLCQVHFSLMDGLKDDTSGKRKWSAVAQREATQHGSLMVISTMIQRSGDFMLPRFEELCDAVLNLASSSKALIRLEIVRLIPRLARRCPDVFGRNYLERGLAFLLDSASTPCAPVRGATDIRPSVYTAIGRLVCSLVDRESGLVVGGSKVGTIKIVHNPENPSIRDVVLCKEGIIYSRLGEIFDLVRQALQIGRRTSSPALYCGANLVEALGDLANPFIPALIDDMFRSGLSNDLIECLHSIAECAPQHKTRIEDRILQEVSLSLAGVRRVYDGHDVYGASSLRERAERNAQNASNSDRVRDRSTDHPKAPETIHQRKNFPRVRIIHREDAETSNSLVLCLQTLTSFAGTIGRTSSTRALPLLPFVHDVVSQYVNHPSLAVRRAAILSCCMLLVPNETGGSPRVVLGSSGLVVEKVLSKILVLTSSDVSGVIRLCILKGLDARYDPFLSQTHHLSRLFLTLQDDLLAIRAAGLQLLGRLALLNPAPVLPVLRGFLCDLVVEMQSGVDTGGGREEAARLLVVFLRCSPLQRLVIPVLESVIEALPLTRTAPPRVAAAALEALGDLAQATGIALQPWVKKLLPHVLEIMSDQSSASKQRTSLRTLGQIAGSTGYVIAPYTDYPSLLGLATDILPATKRAPGALRHEVIRTLGILGALDPGKDVAVTSSARKNGAIGGAYFEEMAAIPGSLELPEFRQNRVFRPSGRQISDKSPAFLSMYEQYAMVAQPISNLPPARRITPKDDDFYPTVSIQAMMRVFCDPSLAVHHGSVIQAIMFIFNTLGLRCVPFLGKVVPHVLSRLHDGSASLRETLLIQLSNLSLLVREHIRTYISDIFSLVEQFWNSRHLTTILGLLANVATGLPDDFRRFVPRLVKRLLESLDELQVVDWSSVGVAGPMKGDMEKLYQILKSVAGLGDVLSEYLHVLVPPLLKQLESLLSFEIRVSSESPEIVAVLCCRTITSLLESCTPISGISMWQEYGIDGEHFGDTSTPESRFPVRVVHPLLRILSKPQNTVSRRVGFAVIETLCTCASILGVKHWLDLFDEITKVAILKWQEGLRKNGDASFDSGKPDCLCYYEDFVRELSKPSLVLAPDTRFSSDGNPVLNEIETVGSSNEHHRSMFELQIDHFDQPLLAPRGSTVPTKRLQVHQRNLQLSWDVSQRSSREDWDEWMRRFAIQLLREAPSPSLRAAANLAQAHQPLARELFCASFACCWKELNEDFRRHLVSALEAVFVADVSPEILLALLNLAEFMEHDPSGGLPVDISILSDLALKCRAYAKALHYKEREYSSRRSSRCVEALISINRKLDLQESALGVLKASLSLGEMHSDVSTSDESTTRFSRHQGHDMFYSVLWSTENAAFDDGDSRLGSSDKEGLWLSKLGEWSEALEVYKERLDRDPEDTEAMLGCMHCHDATGEWREVLDQASSQWFEMIDNDRAQPPKSRRKAVRMCAQAAWRLGSWDELETYSSRLAHSPSATSQGRESLVGLDFEGAFYSAVLHIHRQQWKPAAQAIDAARNAMDGRLTALLAESYSRAYPSMVTAQMLAEMEEIITFRKLEESEQSTSTRHTVNKRNVEATRSRLLSVWRERLMGCRQDVETYSSLLAVRSLVLDPGEEVDSVLTLSKLSREAGRLKFAERVLLDPLQALGADLDGPLFGLNIPETLSVRPVTNLLHNDSNLFRTKIDRIVSGNAGSTEPIYGAAHEQLSLKLVEAAGDLERLNAQHKLYFAYLKHMWLAGQAHNATQRLEHLCDVMDMVAHCERAEQTPLRVACWVELGEWKLRSASSASSDIDDRVKLDVLLAFKRATLLENCGYKAWHSWALINFRIATQTKKNDPVDQDLQAGQSTTLERVTRNHVVAAVSGFVNAISLGTTKQSASVQQDLLNLLTCLFRFGSLHDIGQAFAGAMRSIEIEAWLGVLPQLLARIHIKEPVVRSVLHHILSGLGEKHPQALMYPLSVLLKSPVVERKRAAESLMDSLKKFSNDLVEEAQMVSSELIRVAILWLETWHEGLENASNLCFGLHNIPGMLDVLLPLHEELEKGPESKLECEFTRKFGSDLAKAHSLLKEYIRWTGIDPTGQQPNPPEPPSEDAETIMSNAWDIYYSVFRNVNKMLPSATKLELPMCSPSLSRARNLELGVPGSYRVDGTYVRIERFIPNIQVINSKQRPRKIILRGDDGKDYMFLLKGHEDLRQDERVMQLFGLVNALLLRDTQTRGHDLMIKRYTISPLSHNCGVVGWVPHCDTLHALIRDYRTKVPLNIENREMLRIAPNYDMLTVMQKTEVFTEALKRIPGNGDDLGQIFWLKSTNSEEWLERRIKYTRSLAVMSIVGYILGLGDRHPSNLMIDKLSGRVLHIDFGDCFEIAMVREKYPERVPFRLTRMLIKAMEVSGIEGSYRSTCERTMSVLRSNRDSLVAMLEAFVHDPLISWRLVDLSRASHAAVTDDVVPTPRPTNNVGGRIEDAGMRQHEEEALNESGNFSFEAVLESGSEGNFLTDDRDSVPSAQSGSRTPHHESDAEKQSLRGVSRARSLQLYSSMQADAAKLRADSRIASITAGIAESADHAEASLARSRIERSMRQREALKVLGGKDAVAHETALNGKALKVIRRVEDKLNGTDFPDCEEEPLHVHDQVQRLVVQATSTENLCRLFIGWCAFW